MKTLLHERGVAIGFKVLEAHTERNQTDREIYVIDKCELVEVSVVYDPADPLCRILKASRWRRLLFWLRKYWWLFPLAGAAILSTYLAVRTLC